MGGAIVHGMLGARVFEAGRVVVVEPNDATRAALGKLDCRVASTVEEARALLAARGMNPSVSPSSLWILAVKPQVFPEAARALTEAFGAVEGVVLSIMAGVPAARVHAALGARCTVVRIMPNLAVTVGMGMSAWCPGPGPDPAAAAEWARVIFGTLGEVMQFEESRMDAFTALAGSGPAYLFYLAQAMCVGGQRAGLTPEDADRISRATLRGAAELLHRHSDITPEAWRARVTSPGGTTAAALDVLERAGVMDAWTRAVVAARDRGAQLAQAAAGPAA